MIVKENFIQQIYMCVYIFFYNNIQLIIIVKQHVTSLELFMQEIVAAV